jgi:O-antigen/teichoic acid export membrane protein
MFPICLKEFKGIGWSATAKLLSIVSQYGIVALVSRELTAEKFGAWSLMMHLIAVASILDFGIGGGGLRNGLTKLYTVGHRSAEEKTLFFSSFFFMAALSLLFLGIACIFFHQVFSLLCDQNQEMHMLFFWFVFFILLKLPFTVYASGFYAYQEIQLKALLDCIELLGSVLITFCVASIQGSLLLFFFSHTFFVLVMNMVGFIWFVIRRKWEWGGIPLQEIFFAIIPLLKTHLLFWLQNIASLALFSLSPIAIVFLGGFARGGEYSLIYRLYSVMMGIHFALLNPLWSYYASAWHSHERELLRSKCFRSAVLTVLVLGVSTLGVTLFYQPIIRFWTGKSIECLEVVILSGVWMVLYGVVNCFSILLNALDQIKQQVIFLCVGACLNVFLGVILGKAFPAIGVVVAAIIALLPLLCSNILEVIRIRDKGTV